MTSTHKSTVTKRKALHKISVVRTGSNLFTISRTPNLQEDPVLGLGRTWDRTMSSVWEGSGSNQSSEPDCGSTTVIREWWLEMGRSHWASYIQFITQHISELPEFIGGLTQSYLEHYLMNNKLKLVSMEGVTGCVGEWNGITFTSFQIEEMLFAQNAFVCLNNICSVFHKKFHGTYSDQLVLWTVK